MLIDFMNELCSCGEERALNVNFHIFATERNSNTIIVEMHLVG